MNTPREPLSPDAVDALLSAQLDGELDGAARELGLSESEAQAQLAAAPGIDARRLALTRARDLIAARSRLEPSVEDRLVATALARDDLALVRERRGRRERQWRVLVAAGSVAAAIAVVVGVSATQHGTSSNASKAATAGPQSGAAKAAELAPRDAKGRVAFGDVTRNAALQAPALRLLKPQSGDSAGNTQSDKAATPSSPQPVDAAAGTGTTTSHQESAAAPPACTALVRQRYGLVAAPVIVGTGKVSGKPVVILIFDGAGAPVAYVVSARDCSLVRKQPLG